MSRVSIDGSIYDSRIMECEYFYDVISWAENDENFLEDDEAQSILSNESNFQDYREMIKRRSVYRGKPAILRVSVNSFDEILDGNKESVENLAMKLSPRRLDFDLSAEDAVSKQQPVELAGDNSESTVGRTDARNSVIQEQGDDNCESPNSTMSFPDLKSKISSTQTSLDDDNVTTVSKSRFSTRSVRSWSPKKLAQTFVASNIKAAPPREEFNFEEDAPKIKPRSNRKQALTKSLYSTRSVSSNNPPHQLAHIPISEHNLHPLPKLHSSKSLDFRYIRSSDDLPHEFPEHLSNQLAQSVTQVNDSNNHIVQYHKGNEDFYKLESVLYNGKTFNFDQFRGKVVLIVNAATFCGLSFQLSKFSRLLTKYGKDKFAIIAFLSNDFHQEPFNSQGAGNRCEHFYNVDFPVMKKVHVNGPETHSVYQFLKNSKTPEWLSKLGINQGNYGVSSEGKFNKKILWNYEKFLVDANGQVIKRFHPLVFPHALDKHIAELM